MHKTQSIIVTGASKGIGRFLVEHLIDEGYYVYGCSRNDSTLSHNRYFHFCVDVTDEEEVSKMFKTINAQKYPLYGLINNAGIASMNHSFLTPASTVDRIFNVNFKGTFICSREAAKVMKKFNKGRIINFSTIAVPICLAGEAVYASSKSAVEVFSKTFAKEISRYGITVNIVGPNPINTDLIKSVDKNKIQNVINMQTIKRLGEFQDVRNVVDFYLNTNSDMITGQCLYLGGL